MKMLVNTLSAKKHFVLFTVTSMKVTVTPTDGRHLTAWISGFQAALSIDIVLKFSEMSVLRHTKMFQKLRGSIFF